MTLYIKFKNWDYIFIYNKWDDGGNSNTNVLINNYSGNSKIVRKVFIRLKLILTILIMTITIVLNIVISILDIIKHVLDIVTLLN